MPKIDRQAAVFVSDTLADDTQDEMSDRDSHMDGHGRLIADDARSREHKVHRAVHSGLLELRRNMCTEMVRLEALLGSCMCGAEVPFGIDRPGCHGTGTTIHSHSKGSSWAARGADPRNTCFSEDSTIAAVHHVPGESCLPAGVGMQDNRQSDTFVEHPPSTPTAPQHRKNVAAEIRQEYKGLRRSSLRTSRSFIRTRLAAGLEEDLTQLQKITRSHFFEMFFCAMIVSNSVLMAVHVQYNTDHVGAMSEPLALKCAAHFYNVVFLLELCFRLAAEGCRGFYCNRNNIAWAALDTVVVAVSILHLAVDLYAALGSLAEGDNHFTAGNMRMLRMMRMAKILRTIRAFKVLRFMSALQTLLFSIFVTLKSLAWASVLMAVVIYVFAITFAQCAADGLAELEADGLPLEGQPLSYYWGSLSAAMITLFQTMSNGLDWRPAYEALADTSWMCGAMFNLFVGFAYFVLLNVITGVFCNSAIESARKNPELIVSNRRNYIRNLQNLFQAVDADNSGTITMSEFEMLLTNDMANAHFQAMELNVSDAWTLFKLIDQDGSGTISISEFLTGCEALKGGARTLDVASVSYEAKIANEKLLSHIGRVESILMGLYPEEKRPALFEVAVSHDRELHRSPANAAHISKNLPGEDPCLATAAPHTIAVASAARADRQA